MSVNARVIASSVARLAKLQLLQSGPGPGSQIRIRGFQQSEISEIAVRLDGFDYDGRAEPACVVVGTHTPWKGLEQRLCLGEGRTPTSYRNDPNQTGLLFIESEETSDAQSLSRLSTIDDRTPLSEGAAQRSVLIEAAWAELGGASTQVPRALPELVERVFIHFGTSRMSLRRWVSFVVGAVEPLASANRALDASEVARSIESQFGRLGLLLDSGVLSLDEKKLHARLKRNVLFSDDRDPRGKAVDRFELTALAREIEFLDAENAPLRGKPLKELREAIIARLNPSSERRPSVEFHYWEQLFFAQKKRKGLGAKIKLALVAKDEARAAEFEGLEIETELDDGDQDSAQLLLDLPAPDDDQLPLVELLPRRLRRALERLADPGGRAVDDPLRHLLRQLQVIADVLDRDDEGAVRELEILKSENARKDDRRSAVLFSWLFGPTLAAAFEDADASLGYAVSVAPVLTEAHQKPMPKRKEDEAQEDGWDPLVIALKWKDESVVFHRFEWRPLDHVGSAVFRELCLNADAVHYADEDEFDQWGRSALDGALSGGAADLQEHELISRLHDLRRDSLATLGAEGLSASALGAYVSEWERLLEEAVEEFVPTGSPDPALRDFLAFDTFVRGSEGAVMLASHPIRLRWIAAHLDRMRGLLSRVSDCELSLNEVNDRFYFDRLDQLSPHEQPPLLVSSENLHVAVREEDWHEHYSLLKDQRSMRKGWLAELDDASIEELARAVHEFLDAHPHKADRVSLLVLLRDRGARVLKRLLTRALRDKKQGNIPAIVHVLAPPSEFRAIEDVLADFDDPTERAAAPLPSLEIVLHPWDEDEVTPKLELDELVDVAIVPNLFGAHTRTLERSRKRGQQGRFEPWLDAPTHLADSSSTGASENVSRVLLPVRPDPVLDRWSTASVRAFTNQQVGEGVDHIVQQVRFDLSRDLFSSLHALAHWVVTLDVFIGRDQIEALENRPDVIIVRPRVGKAESYTLVVSSSTGRDFIEARLSRRLVADLASTTEEVAPISSALYQRARFLVPGILLRALGLGWAAQELVGLVIARTLVDSERAASADEGFVAWLSLDEHSRWFGGHTATRADLARIEARWDGERLRVGLCVVEAKFREQINVKLAEKQIRTSLDLLQQALKPRGKYGDGNVWRRAVLEAIEQTSRRSGARDAADGSELRFAAALAAWDEDAQAVSAIPTRVRELWLQGDYELQPAEALLCTVSLDGPGREDVTPDGIRWRRIDRAATLRTFDLLLGREEPTDGEGTPDGPGAEEGGLGKRTSTEPTPGPDDGAPREPKPGEQPGPGGAGQKRASQADLESLYQTVLDTFTEFKVEVRRADDPYREGPAFYVVRVQPGSGVRPETVMSRDAEVKLKLGLPHEFQPRSYIDRGAVVFEIPKTSEQRYFIKAQDLWGRTKFTFDNLYAPIGEDIHGEVVGIDFSSSDSPHLLIAGLTGSGKSVALETILVGLCRHYPPERLRIAAIDPKTTELIAIADEPHILGEIGAEAEEAIDILEESVEEMQRRRQLFRELRVRSIVEYNKKIDDDSKILPWRLVVLDEYADLTADKDDKKKIEHSLQRLSQKARASGIHVIVATQKPSAAVISTTVRSNLGAQLALRVKTASDSRVVMDEGGAEALAGKGDAFFKTVRGVVRVQCAYLEGE